MTVIATRSAFNNVVAFEVSKAELVVHKLPEDEPCEIANAARPVRRLLAGEPKRLTRHPQARLLVVCEATGGYERHVLEALLRSCPPPAQESSAEAQLERHRTDHGGDLGRLHARARNADEGRGSAAHLGSRP